jgi:hypothetical protein
VSATIPAYIVVGVSGRCEVWEILALRSCDRQLLVRVPGQASPLSASRATGFVTERLQISPYQVALKLRTIREQYTPNMVPNGSHEKRLQEGKGEEGQGLQRLIKEQAQWPNPLIPDKEKPRNSLELQG